MQINLNTIHFILLCLILTGCSKAKIQESESTPPKIDNITQAPTTTTPTQSQTLKNTKTTYNGTYEAKMNNPSLAKTQPLHLKLQEDKKFIAYPNHEPNNKTRGNWKVEGDFLICTGTTEQTKQIMTLKIDSISMELISISQKINGKKTEMFLKQFIPKGAKNITFLRKPNS